MADYFLCLPRGGKLSAKIDLRICAVWMSFSRYWAKLYDRPTASLDLKSRAEKSEVVEAIMYGCATWTLLKDDYQKLREAHDWMLLRILGTWCKSWDHWIPLSTPARFPQGSHYGPFGQSGVVHTNECPRVQQFHVSTVVSMFSQPLR